MQYNLGTIPNPTGYQGASGAGLGHLLSNIVAAIFAAVGIFLLLYLLFGAFKYMTAGGDDKAVGEAKKILTNAGIGTALAVGSFFITDILGEVLGFQIFGVSGILAPRITGPTGIIYEFDILNPTLYRSIGTAGSPTTAPVGDLINNVTTAIFVLAGILLLIYLFLGAFKYMTGGGDDKATGSAKSMITNAVIGILIMAVSFFVVRIAGTVLGMPNILNPTFPGP